MRESLGIIEIVGLTTAVFVADTMSKTANINVIDIENTKGLGYMTIKIVGNVAAVKTAISAGEMVAKTSGKFVSSTVIARPSENIGGAFLNFSKEEEKVEKIATEEKEEKKNEEVEETLKIEAKTEVEKEPLEEKIEEKVIKIQEKKIMKKKTQKNSKKRKEVK